MTYIDIGPVKYEVTRKLISEDAIGNCNFYNEMYVNVIPSITNQEMFYQVLWHEIVHVMLFQLSEHGLNDDEKFINQMAFYISDFMIRKGHGRDLMIGSLRETYTICGTVYTINQSSYLKDLNYDIDYEACHINLCEIGTANPERRTSSMLMALVEIIGFTQGMALDSGFVNRFGNMLYMILKENTLTLVHRSFKALFEEDGEKNG